MNIIDKIYTKEEAEPYLTLINNSLKELSLKEFLELQQKYRYINDYYYLKLYTYTNHDSQIFSVNGYVDYDLLNTIVNSYNATLKDNITPVIPNDYYLCCLYSFYLLFCQINCTTSGLINLNPCFL